MFLRFLLLLILLTCIHLLLIDRTFADVSLPPNNNSNKTSSSNFFPHHNLIYQKRNLLLFNQKEDDLQSAKEFAITNHQMTFNKVNQSDIILILTDDQDVLLGSMNFMPKTLKILANQGIHFPNAYVTTPMCCPSRSSIFTGLYSHNHNVHTNNENCSSLQWQIAHEPFTFATYLRQVGYQTAFFGKYLNEYNGTYIPSGWQYWSALIRNSRFYNYTLNINGKKVRHQNNYSLDYYPDLIINESLTFYRKSKTLFPKKPVLMVLSFPSPHGPEDAAPQYQNLFFNVTSHRTLSWNHAPNPDKQWLLRKVPGMKQIHKDFTDLLQTKRLQSLQSVDDAVEKLYDELVKLNTLNHTYIFYSSDHGYHLGQFGLLKGKSMPFESDLKVPLYVRVPKIYQGSICKKIVLNIDFAPTFLEIAGVKVPSFMDGRSMLPLLKNCKTSRSKLQWRDSFLIERGKLPRKKNSKELHFYRKWIKRDCKRDQFFSCDFGQEWTCLFDGNKVKMKKCPKSSSNYLPHNSSANCRCKSSNRSSIFDHDTDLIFREIQHQFRPHHNRHKRHHSDSFDIDKVYHLSRILDVTCYPGKIENDDKLAEFHERSGCILFSNSSIICPNEQVKQFRSQFLNNQSDAALIRKNGRSSRNCLCRGGSLSKIWARKLREIGRNKIKKRLKKMRRKVKFEKTSCNHEKMTCFTHDDSHWKTPPFWTKESFCFCQNAQNNTFWCIRTINEIDNYLYCEFVTGFITFYDLNYDPHQLVNKILDLDWKRLKSLRNRLNSLRNCSGYKNCNQLI